MSGAGTRLAPLEAEHGSLKGRSPLAYLLHALNQPITGLQCALELATAVLQPADYYVRTLREGLELVARIRLLVGAIREIDDLQERGVKGNSILRLDHVIQQAADELHPIAETRRIRLGLIASDSLPLRASEPDLAILVFRSLESALSLAEENTHLSIVARAENGSAWLEFSWIQGSSPDLSPFSQPELGLLIAQAGWEQMGGTWRQRRNAERETVTVCVPLSSSSARDSGRHTQSPHTAQGDCQ